MVGRERVLSIRHGEAEQCFCAGVYSPAGQCGGEGTREEEGGTSVSDHAEACGESGWEEAGEYGAEGGVWQDG